MLVINKRGRDQTGEKEGIDQRQRGAFRTERQPANQEGDSGKKLDQVIANGDLSSAIPAFAAEDQPGKQRYIQIPRDGIFAVWTVRRRPDNTFPERQPVNANIEKTSHHGPEDKENDAPEMKRHSLPDFRLKDRLNHRLSTKRTIYLALLCMPMEHPLKTAIRGPTQPYTSFKSACRIISTGAGWRVQISRAAVP